MPIYRRRNHANTNEKDIATQETRKFIKKRAKFTNVFLVLS